MEESLRNKYMLSSSPQCLILYPHSLRMRD